MADAVARLPKPNMRYIVRRHLKKGLAVSAVLSGVVAWYYKVYHMDYRQRKTKEFYDKYDPPAEFERLRDLGLFQWAKPKDESKAKYNFYTFEAD